MAKESVNILKDKIDIVDLLAQLNAALSEEWLAFYQYWVGSFVVEGAMRGDVQREFQEHAAEEYNHAKLLADRIIELEGVPVLDPKQWFDLARCKYDAPVDFGSEILFTQGRYLNTVFVRHFAKASAFMALRRWMRMAASAPKASLLPRKSISSAWSRRVMSDSNSWCSLSMMVSDTALWMMGKS